MFFWVLRAVEVYVLYNLKHAYEGAIFWLKKLLPNHSESLLKSYATALQKSSWHHYMFYERYFMGSYTYVLISILNANWKQLSQSCSISHCYYKTIKMLFTTTQGTHKQWFHKTGNHHVKIIMNFRLSNETFYLATYL